MTNVKR